LPASADFWLPAPLDRFFALVESRLLRFVGTMKSFFLRFRSVGTELA